MLAVVRGFGTACCCIRPAMAAVGLEPAGTVQQILMCPRAARMLHSVQVPYRSVWVVSIHPETESVRNLVLFALGLSARYAGRCF